MLVLTAKQADREHQLGRSGADDFELMSEERRQLVQASLFRQAQARLTELQRQEAKKFTWIA